jgi:endo-1,4-beta-D-glucanase Y/4-amino-4-deoxy-L-arabinose transferase-like glycosyltransferase
MTNMNVSHSYPHSSAYSRARLSRGERVRSLSRYFAGEWPIIAVLMLIGLIAHGLNMFNYPALHLMDDEGIYAAQAWAILREGQLTPYTYFYDHAPAGWIMLAGWHLITGGQYAFGSAVESGRVLMLVLHVAMIPLLYILSRKLGAPAPAAALGGVLFSISPLAIFYQRLVLLDTMMLFWVLLSLVLLLDDSGRLSRMVLSGVFFAVAVLTKETAIFLLPAFLYLAFLERRRHQGGFAVGAWVMPMIAVGSWYPFYALLKGELFPSSLSELHLFADDAGTVVSGVSLIGTLAWQAGREGGGMFNLDNLFWTVLQDHWIKRDAILLLGGFGATVVNLLRGFKDRRVLVAGMLGILPVFYLARGGYVMDFYILFAIPFLCLNIAVLFGAFRRPASRYLSWGVPVSLVLVLVAAYWQLGTIQPLYAERLSDPQRESLAWMKQNLPPESYMVIRDDMWVDLQEEGAYGGPAFPNAHSHWKVGDDPEIRDDVFGNDWRNVDYVVVNGPHLGIGFRERGNDVTADALENGHLIREWTTDVDDVGLHPFPVIQLWKVKSPGTTEPVLLDEGMSYIDQRFGNNGAYANADGSVFSENQAYAMLRAVWSDDRESFDAAWSWTREELLRPDGLLAWRWENGEVVDPSAAADADIDAALALLMASRQWNDWRLLEEGTAMVKAIWEHEVVEVDGKPFLAAGPWATTDDIIALNPSYFSPYAYHIFQEVDPSNDWLGLITTGYDTLFALGHIEYGDGTPAGLPPDWIGLDRATGELVPLVLDGRDTTRYGYDAARTYWRVALHRLWVDDGRAWAYLEQAGFLQEEVERKGWVSAVYSYDGEVVEPDPSTVGTAGALGALMALDPELADDLFATEFIEQWNREDGQAYWGNPDDLYAQEWAWFAIALYADALPNLWHE